MPTSELENNTSLEPVIIPGGPPIAFSPGPYNGYWQDGEQPFAIEVDAKPLKALVEDARNGVRVYELMSINRPGDIYCYLRVRTADVSKAVNKRTESLKPRWDRSGYLSESGEGYYSFNRFDGLFYWGGDDTTPESECWLRFREGKYWEQTAIRLLKWISKHQKWLRLNGDWLTQREIDRMDQRRHRRDFISILDRLCLAKPQCLDNEKLPDPVIEVIRDLITRDTVQSVSAPYKDYRLWRLLCEQQLRRSDSTGYLPKEAFTLSGPDGGLDHVPYKDWGADVHIPYEGACMADLFIKPDWRCDNLGADRANGQLVQIYNAFGYSVKHGYVCHYVLTPKDLGELQCASRIEVGNGWILYQSRQPYQPNPRCKPHLLKGYEGDSED